MGFQQTSFAFVLIATVLSSPTWAFDPTAKYAIENAEYAEAIGPDMAKVEYGVDPCPGGTIDARVIARGGVSYVYPHEFNKNGIPGLDEFEKMSQAELDAWYYGKLLESLNATKTWLHAGYDLCRPDGYATGYRTPARGELQEHAEVVKLESGKVIKKSYSGMVTVFCCMPKK